MRRNKNIDSKVNFLKIAKEALGKVRGKNTPEELLHDIRQCFYSLCGAKVIPAAEYNNTIGSMQMLSHKMDTSATTTR